MDGVLTDSSNLDLERYPWTIQMALVFLSYRLDFFFLGGATALWASQERTHLVRGLCSSVFRTNSVEGIEYRLSRARICLRLGGSRGSRIGR